MTTLVAEKNHRIGGAQIKKPTALHFAAIKEFRSVPQ
jgi:hypothetical protein